MEYLVAASSRCWNYGAQRVVLLAIVTEKLHEIERLLASCFASHFSGSKLALAISVFHLTCHLILNSS